MNASKKVASALAIAAFGITFLQGELSASARTLEEVLRQQFSTPSTKAVEDLTSYSDLETLIQKKNILSIDDLISELPQDYRAGYTMIYKTKALGRHLISPRRPRILMYGASGNLMMTFNSHASGGAARPGEVEYLETIEFKGDRAFLRELAFDGKSSPLSRQVEVNPAKCTQCHGADPKGLWEPYNTWPGVFGSLSRGGVDFIRVGTGEHSKFQEFLNERLTNPRYASLPFFTLSLRDLDSTMTSLGLKLLRPFEPTKMEEAVTFTDGHSLFTNQRVGMLVARHAFKRLARKLTELPVEIRSAYQYLVAGVGLDEKGPERDLGTFTNLYNNKEFKCLPKIDSFFPQDYFKKGKKQYQAFHNEFIEEVKLDYNAVKAEVELENLGLSKTSPGFSEDDVFDQAGAGRQLIYDTQLPPLFFHNHFNKPGKPFVGQGGTAVPYLFYVMGIPQSRYSTSASGNRYNMYYGNSAGCYGPRGENSKGWECFVEDVEAFVTMYVPKSFYTDPQIHSYDCDELARRSREAISKL